MSCLFLLLFLDSVLYDLSLLSEGAENVEFMRHQLLFLGQNLDPRFDLVIPVSCRDASRLCLSLLPLAL